MISPMTSPKIMDTKIPKMFTFRRQTKKKPDLNPPIYSESPNMRQVKRKQRVFIGKDPSPQPKQLPSP